MIWKWKLGYEETGERKNRKLTYVCCGSAKNDLTMQNKIWSNKKCAADWQYGKGSTELLIELATVCK